MMGKLKATPKDRWKAKPMLKYLLGADYKDRTKQKPIRKPISIEKALKKTYTVKNYGSTTCLITVPCSLNGRKVKLILLGGNNEPVQ